MRTASKRIRNRNAIGANKGQFVVIAAMIIGLLVMGTALGVNQLTTTRKALAYTSLKETLLMIASDMERAVAHALSAASHKYDQTGYQDEAATQEGLSFISTWTRAVVTAHSNLGLEMTFEPTSEGYTPVKFAFDWRTPTGRSWATTLFKMNATGLGFTGWAGERIRGVMLVMDVDSIVVQPTPMPGTTTLSFMVTDENDAPVADLAPENLEVYIHLTGSLWLPVKSKDLQLNYNGAGAYTLTIARRLNDQSRGLILKAQTPDDLILVQAYYLESEGATQGFGLNQIFQSQGLDGSSNLGMITTGSFSPDPLPRNSALVEGSYAMSFTPADGYEFLNWTTTGNVSVQDPYSDLTQLIVNGSGTVTAFYGPAAPETLRGWSEQVGGGNPKPGNLNLTSTQGQSLASGPQITYQYNDSGSYLVSYTANTSTVFVNWRSQGNVAVDSPFTASTTVLVGEGGGDLIAVYQPLGSLSLSSLEENGRSYNLGNVTLENQNGQRILQGPAPQVLYNVTAGSKYTAVYAPESDYIFLYWRTLGNVSFVSPSSSVSNPAKVSVGSGANAMIAIYRQVADVQLDSYDWEGLSANHGWTKFNGTDNLLPKSFTGIRAEDYSLAFTPQQTNETFLWWETTGDVIIGNSLSNSTYAVVNGDCNITAVYATSLVSPRQPGGPWDILYVDADYMVNPVYLWTQDDGKLAPSFSMGNDKLAAVLYSPLTPKLQIPNTINVSVIVRPNPPNSVKEVYVELGYIYPGNVSGTYHQIGNDTKPVMEVGGVYTLRMDALQGDYVSGDLIIPEGSVIQFTVVLTFYKEYAGWGTFFLFYGALRTSYIELGGEVVP